MNATTRRTPDEVFVQTGCQADRLYIAIPHQRRPYLAGPDLSGEPDESAADSSFLGDHDLHAAVTIEDALAWNGHQEFVVRVLAESVLYRDDDAGN